MEKRLFLRGNEAVARGAIDAGCRYYFGYPITPQNEIPEYFASVLPKIGGAFIQAESEIASINMLLGASAAGARAMTSSSGPGISLKQEGISYMAGSELPAVIVNIARSGPGLGGIAPSQAEYFQATKGGGHGDYRLIVLAPHSCQEMYSLTIKAFELAEKYRNPALILADAVLGQMKEMVTVGKERIVKYEKPWALCGTNGRKQNIIKSLYLDDGEMEKHIYKIFDKYKKLAEEDLMFEEKYTDSAEIVIVAFGTAARIAKTVIQIGEKENIKIGFFRPITLFPFPSKALYKLSQKKKKFLVLELNMGQMVYDVKLSVKNKEKVYFYGRPPGAGSLPAPEEILEKIKEIIK